MRLSDFRLLADENIHPEVVEFLRHARLDVCTVAEAGLIGATDRDILAFAIAERRVIVTHDSDFGTLTVGQQLPVTGVVYLRPGHIDSNFTIESLRVLLSRDDDLPSQFVIVVRRAGDNVTIRIRDVSTDRD